MWRNLLDGGLGFAFKLSKVRTSMASVGVTPG